MFTKCFNQQVDLDLDCSDGSRARHCGIPVQFYRMPHRHESCAALCPSENLNKASPLFIARCIRKIMQPGKTYRHACLVWAKMLTAFGIFCLGKTHGGIFCLGKTCHRHLLPGVILYLLQGNIVR